MAIAFDATSQGQNSGATSLTVAHTITGSNTALVVGVYDDAGDTVTGVTCNGVAMTQSRKVQFGNYTKYLYIYTLVAPTTGDIVASRSSSTGVMNLIAASYTGVLQTGQPEASNGTNYPAASQTAITTSVTTATNNAWIIACGVVDNVATPTPNGVTRRDSGGLSGGLALGDTNGPKSPAGAYTVGFDSTSGNQKGGMNGVAFAPIEVATGNALMVGHFA